MGDQNTGFLAQNFLKTAFCDPDQVVLLSGPLLSQI